MLKNRQDMILAAQGEKQAIVEMVRDGVDLELYALQELIDKYGNTLDARKNLYDYQKRISKQSKEVSSLQKQLSAYAAAYEGAEQSNRHMLKLGKRQESAQAQTVVQNFDNIRFEMPNVKNYGELVRQMQADNQFEKLIQSMTIDRLAGRNSLEKFKFRF